MSEEPQNQDLIDSIASTLHNMSVEYQSIEQEKLKKQASVKEPCPTSSSSSQITSSTTPEPTSTNTTISSLAENLSNAPTLSLDEKLQLTYDPNTNTGITPEDMIRELAISLYDGTCCTVSHYNIASWIGDSGKERGLVRKAYMSKYNWTGMSVLEAVRSLCDHLYMKAESQQLDRIVDAFADRWHECNPNHGFKSSSVVYTLAYSILLLNTDHHSEEYAASKKMPRSQYVQSTLDAMRTLALDGKQEFEKPTNATLEVSSTTTVTRKRWTSSMGGSHSMDNTSLVSDTKYYSLKEWEFIVTSIIKSVYISVDTTPLNLAIPESDAGLPPNTNLPRRGSWVTANGNWSDYEYSDAIANNSGRRQSVFSTESSTSTALDHNIGFAGALWSTMNREEPQKTPKVPNDEQTIYAEDSKLDHTDIQPDIEVKDTVEANSIFSGSSVGSGNDIEMNFTQQNGIMDPSATPCASTHASVSAKSQQSKALDLQHEEELTLSGAPWAKEGLLRFHAFFEKDSLPKKYKKKGWTEIFVVVQRGYLKMFQFNKNGPAKKKSVMGPFNKTKTNNSNNIPVPPESFENPLVGSGNWLGNATMTDNISLCHTMAQIIHIGQDGTDLLGVLPGISAKSNKINLSGQVGDSVHWSLKLPNGGVLAFLAGTREIADEYVYTCNYWAARVSREPLVEAVSSNEFGWGKPLKLVFRTDRSITSSSASVTSSSVGGSETPLSIQASHSSNGSGSVVIASKSAFARRILRKQSSPILSNTAAQARLQVSPSSTDKISMLNPVQAAKVLTKPSKSKTSAAAASAAATAAATSLLSVTSNLLHTAAMSHNSKNQSILERVSAKKSEVGTLLVNGGKKFYIASGSYDVMFINNIIITIHEWRPPVQSAVQSMLDEGEQLEVLKRYTAIVDDILEDHTSVRGQMMSVYTPQFPVTPRVTANWEKRSNYLLCEIVKYNVYISTLTRAIDDRARMSRKVQDEQ